jgi:PAS domain S-box-containing protein
MADFLARRSPRWSTAPLPGVWRHTAGWEALALALLAAVVLVLAHRFDLFESVVAWGRRWAVAGVPDLLVTVLVLAFAVKVYAWRRWRETSRALGLLRRERDFADAIVGTTGALILVLDLRGNIVRFNRACEALTGYAAAEVLERPFWELFLLPDERKPVVAVFADLAAGRYPNSHENHWVARDGAQYLIAWQNTARLDARGAVAYVIATGLDITARRQAEDALRVSEARYRALFDAAPIGIALADSDRRLLACNPAYARLVGHDEGALRGCQFPVVTHPEDAAPDLALYRELLTGQRAGYALDKRYVRPDGVVVWGHLTVTLVRDAAGAPLFTIGMVEDRTMHRVTVDDLAVAHTTLAGQADNLRRLQTKLSPQEWRVLPLLAQGLTYNAIGAQLHLSGETVKTHVQRIGDKLGCGRRRTDVLAAARAQGLIPVSSTPPPPPI